MWHTQEQSPWMVRRRPRPRAQTSRHLAVERGSGHHLLVLRTRGGEVVRVQVTTRGRDSGAPLLDSVPILPGGDPPLPIPRA